MVFLCEGDWAMVGKTIKDTDFDKLLKSLWYRAYVPCLWLISMRRARIFYN